MKQLKFIKKLGLVVLVIFAIALSVFLTHPSNAQETQYANMIKLGLVDAIKTPNELGLDYLQQPPPQLTASLLQNASLTAIDKVQSTDNIRVKIPFPSSPDSIVPGQMTGIIGPEGRPVAHINRFEAFGILNKRSGQIQGIYPQGYLIAMFMIESRGCSNLCNIDPSIISASEGRNLILDATGQFYQRQPRSLFDIAVYDRMLDQAYLIRNVDASSFCRDALNAVLEDTWEAL